MRTFSLLFALVLSGLSLSAQTDSLAVAELLDSKAYSDFSGVVSLLDATGMAVSVPVGLAHEVPATEMSATNAFRIGYLTELYTAVCILQLVESGRLALESTVKELVPEVELEGEDAITLAHLLTHTSGVPRIDSMYTDRLTPSRLAHSYAAKTEDYAPIGTYRHSQLDYILLGMVAEKFNMKNWQYLVEDDVVRKLGLEHTDEHERGQLIDGMCTGYLTTGKTRTPEPRYRMGNMGAAGCMYSTASDMATFYHAFCTGHFFSTAALDQLDAFGKSLAPEYPGMRTRTSIVQGFSCHIEPGLLILSNTNLTLGGLVGDVKKELGDK